MTIFQIREIKNLRNEWYFFKIKKWMSDFKSRVISRIYDKFTKKLKKKRKEKKRKTTLNPPKFHPNCNFTSKVKKVAMDLNHVS